MLNVKKNDLKKHSLIYIIKKNIQLQDLIEFDKNLNDAKKKKKLLYYKFLKEKFNFSDYFIKKYFNKKYFIQDLDLFLKKKKELINKNLLIIHIIQTPANVFFHIKDFNKSTISVISMGRLDNELFLTKKKKKDLYNVEEYLYNCFELVKEFKVKNYILEYTGFKKWK